MMQKFIRGGDYVARFGGDEFVTLLTDIHVEADIKQYLRRMQKVFSSPFQVNEIEFELRPIKKTKTKK